MWVIALPAGLGMEFSPFLRHAVCNRLLQEDRLQNKPEQQSQTPVSNTIKDPEQWKTGDEPMTGAQRSYLSTLASEAGEEVEEELTKADASKKIDELQEKTGRGK